MAQQPLMLEPKYWGSCTHSECHKANHPYDAYLKLYKKQYRKSVKRNKQSNKDNTSIYKLEKTMSLLNPTINDILFDDSAWNKHFRYKHKNPSYLEKQSTESFYDWYNKINSTHQIPKFKQRNRIALIPITDDQTLYIDNDLISKLSELVFIYFGLKLKQIDVSNTNNVLLPKKNNDNNFVTKDIHNKLSAYYNNDKDLFAIIGICCKIGIFSKNNKVCHGESNSSTQSAVCSFSKLGIYNKNIKNIPQWLKIRRSGKILLHEIAHLYGIQHCEYFRCLMNKDVVLDNVPMTLCPICLNKLYFSMIKYNHNRNTFEYDIDHVIVVHDNDDDDDNQQQSQNEGKKNRLHVLNGLDDDDDDIEEKKDAVATVAAVAAVAAAQKKKLSLNKKKQIDNNTFNLLQRYEKLAEWFNEHKLFREATWYKNRTQSLQIQ